MARVTHFEFYAEQPERAMEFYHTVFGWRFERWKGPTEYWFITTGPSEEPGINGGMMRRDHTITGDEIIAFLCTIDVESIDKTLASVSRAGGKIVYQKNVVSGIGWMSYCKDTEGNFFGVIQNDPKAR
jgi:hypothetical protein